MSLKLRSYLRKMMLYTLIVMNKISCISSKSGRLWLMSDKV